MDLKLKIVRGHNPDEQMKSVDGILNSHSKKLADRGPDEGLVQEVTDLRQIITTLLDHLGLVIESGPEKVIRRVRLIEDEIGTDNSL